MKSWQSMVSGCELCNDYVTSCAIFTSLYIKPSQERIYLEICAGKFSLKFLVPIIRFKFFSNLNFILGLNFTKDYLSKIILRFDICKLIIFITFLCECIDNPIYIFNLNWFYWMHTCCLETIGDSSFRCDGYGFCIVNFVMIRTLIELWVPLEWNRKRALCSNSGVSQFFLNRKNLIFN